MELREGNLLQKTAMQLLLLVVGLALIFSRHHWGKPMPVLLAGIFFLNLSWITLVLGHNLAIWSWIRNSLIGNLAMIVIVLANLLAIVISALWIF